MCVRIIIHYSLARAWFVTCKLVSLKMEMSWS